MSSDSDLMLEMALSEGADTHKRMPEYCDEKTKSFGEVVAHICDSVEGEHIIWATCTSPLVLPENYLPQFLSFHWANILYSQFDR